MFPGCDGYYSPFLAPDNIGSFKPGFLKKRFPDAGYGINLVPQLLVNNKDAFLNTAVKLTDMGYRHINLNAGCPSGTVFSKHKGSGMLADKDSLNRCLEGIFNGAEKIGIKVSIKTRMGIESTDEFPEILEIYNRYPVERLIIHARDRKGLYQSRPDVEGFKTAFTTSINPVSYNGEVFSTYDMNSVVNTVPELESVMIGRGGVANPALVRMLQGGAPLELEELREFHDRILDESLSEGLSPGFAVERMKGLWYYMIWLFPGSEKAYKAIKKARRIEDYRSAVSALFKTEDFDGSHGFPGTRTE